MISRWLNRRVLLWCAGLVSLAYAVTITTLNLLHIRTMPEQTRVLLPSLDTLTAASLPVRIVESLPTGRGGDAGLERRDVHVEYGRDSFPPSRSVWVNTALPRSDRGRYLHRFRAGYLRDDAGGADLEALFLIEVHQAFGEHGDEPRANLWLFPLQQQADGAGITDALAKARFAHNILLSEARRDPQWRAVFADAHARIVRAFPALAAALIGIAAFGSLLFRLWRQQSWAVAATTVTFVLPIVSAAPFLTAFGWTPIMAAVLLGFFITVAIVSAIEQRVAPLVSSGIGSGAARRLFDASLVPVAALLVGTALTVSFASVSVIPLQGLGSASPGEIFRQSLIVPATGLLLGGTGTCLVLTLFRLVFNWRTRASMARTRPEG